MRRFCKIKRENRRERGSERGSGGNDERAAYLVIYVYAAVAGALTVETLRWLGLVAFGRLIGPRTCARTHERAHCVSCDIHQRRLATVAGAPTLSPRVFLPSVDSGGPQPVVTWPPFPVSFVRSVLLVLSPISALCPGPFTCSRSFLFSLDRSRFLMLFLSPPSPPFLSLFPTSRSSS